MQFDFSPIQQVFSQLTELPNEAVRLFHGRGRCYPSLEQLSIDFLSGQIMCTVFKEQGDAWMEGLRDCLNTLIHSDVAQKQLTCVFIQHRYRVDNAVEILFGRLDEQVVVTENGLKFELSLGKKQNTGLFFDMRNGRDWVKKQSENKKVLNLFAYTCGFSVAAVAGGAKQVVNLDMAKAALNQGRRNHQLNDHALDNVSFLGHDLFKSWGKLRKFGPYDLVIIDPPTFQKGSFALTKDYQRILRKLPELLYPGATVLACVNDPTVQSQFLIDEMHREAPSMTFIERLENPAVFEDIDPQGGLKCLVFSNEHAVL
ncbi:class I SAM-dependent methyltransferase [Pseudoalteromonas luteoviolacea]|uniref:class I SAM-dependent methyltransferase n=1 Tax=Pseudoalteromonas luteoviolacea TaxID=43657 RepID=UPI001F217B71|nr:class I SAM-dependent methyltransferase [Pseudoalteromonas luteoviolacea]MCF6441584.1 class I SAM-dependent methyltransferase [Pseudoalteromonas luteoviolacea]